MPRRLTAPHEYATKAHVLTETRDRRKQGSADAASERAFPAGNVEARTITVSGWTVRQIDPLNWACEHDGRPRMYASDLAEALKLMLRQIAGDHARKDLKGCLQAIRYAEERIVAALK